MLGLMGIAVVFVMVFGRRCKDVARPCILDDLFHPGTDRCLVCLVKSPVGQSQTEQVIRRTAKAFEGVDQFRMTLSGKPRRNPGPRSGMACTAIGEADDMRTCTREGVGEKGAACKRLIIRVRGDHDDPFIAPESRWQRWAFR